MFAPHHQAAADELVRVCRPGGTLALLSWTPEGMLGALFKTMAEFAPPPPPGAQPRRSGAARNTSPHCSATASSSARCKREVLEITAFEHAHDYGRHFRSNYGPTIAVEANARRTGREAEFAAALD